MFGIAIEAELDGEMIYIVNEDAPGFIGRLGTTLGEAGVNIATFHLGRREAGGEAVALVSVDGHIDAGAGRRGSRHCPASSGSSRCDSEQNVIERMRERFPHAPAASAFRLARRLSAAAAEPEWRAAPEYDVLLRPFDYEPPTIRLAAGRPVKLRFVNQGQATFSFSAEPFFRAAQVRAGDVALVTDGQFEARSRRAARHRAGPRAGPLPGPQRQSRPSHARDERRDHRRMKA